MPVQTATSAPSVVTGDQAGLWQALAGGLPDNSRQAVQAQLAVMQKKMANKRYITECILKEAPALTNGLTTQAFANSTAFTFNLPQPNNAYARGIIVRTTLNYTLAVGTGATYGLTAAGSLALYDTIEVKYNKSQIKIRPVWLRHLAMAGAVQNTLPALAIPSVASTDAGGQNDAQLSAYLNPAMPTATGAQTYQQDIFIPFNILSRNETRGLLPAMPGETGIQVIATTAAGIFGPDPIYNAIYATGGTGNAISAVSGTIKVIMVYSDGEVYSQPVALPYDMSILNGTIQMQMDNMLTSLVTGAANVNRGKLNILGKHQYVGLALVDGNASNAYSATTNLLYLSSDKDSVGANSFWKYGQGTNLDINDFYLIERTKHRHRDLDEGIIFMVEAPLAGQGLDGDSEGTQYLDNSTNGWPAWHYGFSINTQNGLGTVTPRCEPMTIFVNPVGLPPVGM